MLLRLSRILGLGMAGMALANVAWAAEGGSSGATVTTGAVSAKIGGEFRSELIYDDNGFEKVMSDETPKKSTTIGVSAVNITLSGNINKETEYGFRFNLLHPAGGSPLDYGYGTHWFSKMVGFSAGKMRVMQGGWDHMDASYRSHTDSILTQNLVFADYSPMFALQLNVAGRVTVQILDDVMADPKNTADEHFNKEKHPTWVLGWMGSFGPIKPLVDVGSYDNNKSRWIDLAVKTEMHGLAASVDFHNRNDVHRRFDASGDVKEDADGITSFAINAAYELKNVMTPWFHYSSYSNKQADDKDTGSEDIKVNSGVDAATGEWAFNDNGTVLGVGADLNMMGKGWNPFVAMVSTSGKFTNYKGEETSASRMQIKLGVLGEI